MPQPAIKRRSAIEKRLDRCKVKTLNSLLENYQVVFPVKEPFHFFVHDSIGLKYIRIELESLLDAMKETMIEFKKKCPPNTIIEVRIFEKHAQKPIKIAL